MEGWTRVMNLAGDQTAKASSSASLKSGDVVSYQFPAGLRVLVVDSDSTCLRILEKMLRQCLYEVTKCDRAEIALKLLRNNRNGYDIVISEVHMPGIDGFKLLELVRLEMDLPVIMISANDSMNIVMKGVTHGACDYLIKPVRIEALENIWQHVVRKRMHEWKDKEQSGSAEEVRLVKPPRDVDYSSSATEGNWKTSKKRKDVEDEPEEKDDTSSLTPHVVWPVDLHQQWPVDKDQQFAANVNQLGIDRVDAANNSMNGIYEQQNRIVECSPGQEPMQNTVSIAHNEPIALINVADPERDGADIEQNGDEETSIIKQKSSCTLKSDLGVTREILEQNSWRKLEDAAKFLEVSRSTLKRICREYGIHRWPPRKAKKVNLAFVEQKVVQPSTENIEECHRLDTRRLENDSSMWVKAEYQGYTVKIRLPLSARKFNLEEQVAQRFNLSIGSFKIEYQDEDNEWIWITCDEDLSISMSTLNSLGRTTIKMLISGNVKQVEG